MSGKDSTCEKVREKEPEEMEEKDELEGIGGEEEGEISVLATPEAAVLTSPQTTDAQVGIMYKYV